MNKIIVIGYLGNDPEMRYMPNGESVTQFNIASSHRYRTREGEQRDETEWFRVSAYGRLGDTCNQYLAKGRQVYVEGRLRGRSYADRDGQPRYSLEINASNVHFLSSRDSSGYSNRSGGNVGDGGSDDPPWDESDDLPF